MLVNYRQFVPKLLLIAIFASLVQCGGLFNGPAFPAPTTFATSKKFQDTIESFNKALDAALKHGLPGNQLGSGYALNTTSFSVAMFSTSSSGLLYERHYTDPVVRNSTAGTRRVDGNSIFRIGSVSKLLTVYLLLILDGERILGNTVTDYSPNSWMSLPVLVRFPRHRTGARLR